VLALCAQEAHDTPRRVLSLLAICSDCTTRPEASHLINAPTAKDQVPDGLAYQLAQALRTPKWSEVQLLLRGIQETQEHPEGIRRLVGAHFAKMVATGKDERSVCYALRVLDHFAEPMTDLWALFLAMGRIIFGDRR
jgi:hypothetical protein